MKLPITPFLDSFRVGDHSGVERFRSTLRRLSRVIVAAAVGFSVYLVGLIASFWLPEPKREELPE